MADFHQSIASGPTSQFPALDIDTSPHDYSDVDSGFGASIARTENSYAVTMGSGICPYVYENGRRYQVFREGVYMLPNDSEEIERLDQYHRIFLALLDGKLYIAPLGEHSQKVRHVLDIGTGTGAWAIDMAEEFPDAEVIGNDLSKIQPPWADADRSPHDLHGRFLYRAPENCKFEIDDIESDWTYPENHFDFIHLRSLSGCFEDWGMVLSRCYNHTAPGGYIEFQDYDCILKSALGTVPNGAVARYWRMVCDAAESTGRIFQVASTIEGLLKAAGFVDVTVRKELWPLGPWPKDERMKEIGRLTKPGLRSAFHAFASALLTRVLGWTDIQVKELCQEATQEINDGSSQLYVTAYYVCGRKPS